MTASDSRGIGWTMIGIIALGVAIALIWPAGIAHAETPSHRVNRIASDIRSCGLAVPSWCVRACIRSLGREHTTYKTCYVCKHGGHHSAGHVGPLQFARAWGSGKCRHGYYDWRRCINCSVKMYLTRGAQHGRPFIRRHWGQTCGSLT